MGATMRSGSETGSYLIARQPIVDTKLKLVGYELLYRSVHDQLGQISGAVATARVLSTTFGETDFVELVGDCTGFINMTRESILDLHLLSLPSQHVVFEILEDIEIDPILLRKIEQLKELGYRFALDDFTFKGIHNDYIELADIIKVDVMELTKEELVDHAEQLKQYPGKLIAEKVETWEEFELCRDLGFDMFQGYFFSKPQLMKGSSIPHNRSATYRLVSELSSPNVSFDDLEALVNQDPGLSYKLFRYANSAFFSRSKEFSNLRQVIVLFGIDRLRAIAAMFAMCQMDEKPSALLRMLLQRAQLCRLLATEYKRENPEDYFTVGMFSLIDAFMDKPLQEVLESIPLPKAIRAAILNGDGDLGKILAQAIKLEQASEKQLETAIDKYGDKVDAYNQAARWATETMKYLAD